jgi:hypothetical protein
VQPPSALRAQFTLRGQYLVEDGSFLLPRKKDGGMENEAPSELPVSSSSFVLAYAPPHTSKACENRLQLPHNTAPLAD